MFVLSRSRSRSVRSTFAVVLIGVVAWSMLGVSGASADEGGNGKGRDKDAPTTEVPATTVPPITTAPTTTPPTTKAPKVERPVEVLKPIVPAAPQVQRKIIVRKYIEAPAAPVPSPAPVAQPQVSPPPATAPETPASEIVEPAKPSEPAPAPVVEEVPSTQLALAENASSAATSAGMNLTILATIAAALAIAVVGLGGSMALFHRFGAVGAHSRGVPVPLGRAPEVNFDFSAVSGLLGRLGIHRADDSDDEKVSSADLALRSVTAETSVIEDESAS